jgi:hypothetical protein
VSACDGNTNVEMCGVTRMDRIRNEYIRGSLKVASRESSSSEKSRVVSGTK